MNVKFLIAFLITLFTAFCTYGQTNPADSVQVVEIISAKKLQFKKISEQTELQILVGKVSLKQGFTLFFCDSCVINRKQNVFEAFGNVHIIDNDTSHVYANYLKYMTDVKMAHLKKNVKLYDGHITLTTNELDYDLMSRIGTYKNGGKVLNEKSVLTSKDGIYYADLRDIYFKNKVELKDPAYFLKADSLLYNTEFQTARFISNTYIKDSSNRVMRTTEGFYDLKNGKAEFSKRTSIEDKALTVTGDQIVNDDATGIVQIRGRGVLKDTAQGISILANEIFVNKNTNAFLATIKPLMIVKQEKDSIYITADTLFSARLSDLKLAGDTTKTTVAKNDKDSTNRYFEAFRNVRVFADSVQTISDSLFYSFRDSTFQLYQNPVVWSNGSQITGDTILLYTKNKKAERVKVFENGLLVNEIENGVYNQIKATRMDGYFIDGMIDSVRAKGMAESIYFLQDEDSAYSGINQTQSDIMDVYFKEGGLNKVIFRSSVKGTLWPMNKKQPSEMRLPDFQWLEEKRPKTKYELFE